MPAVRVVISGRVQGVGYRAWTVSTARRLGLSGWVRNRADGTVEAVFSGDEPAIQLMIDSCREGPMASMVADVIVASWNGEVAAGFIRLATL